MIVSSKHKFIMARISLAALPLVLFVSIGLGQTSIQLVANKISKYNIVIPPQASKTESQAAQVLQKYIFQISSCYLPINNDEKPTDGYQIVIGNSKKLTKADMAGLDEDGILIKKVSNSILISGGNRKGILYAVYTFLEEYLGCRAFSSNYIFVPRTNTIQLPSGLYKKEIPSFGYRMLHFPDAFDSTYCNWRKINYVYEDWGLWVHTFIGLVPPSQYFKDHPEYFALINGKRDTAQLCPSHPEVVNIVVSHLRLVIKAKPWAKYWSVSQNDNQEYCKCLLCNRINKEQESPTGALLNFVNKVAVQFPDKIISTLAYGYSEKPPKTIKPLSNVMIMLTTSSLNDRRLPLSGARTLGFDKYFKKWASITNHLMIWDYLVRYANLLLPLPNVNLYQPNLRYFAKQSPKYLFMQGSGNVVTEFSELKAYLLSKMMWNKDMDFKAEQNEFLNEYYGPVGGKYMGQYLEMISAEAKSARSSMLLFQWYDTSMFATYLSHDNLLRYKQLFEDALGGVQNNSLYKERLIKEYAALLYAELENNVSEMSKGTKVSLEQRRIYQQQIEKWITLVKQTTIKTLSVSGISVNDYYEHYQRALKFL